LVEEESAATVITALREVIALYSDRASHFFHTPKAGQPMGRHRPTQVARALGELEIQLILAYPQPRGRGKRNFGTWQGRLPRSCGSTIHELAAANEFFPAERR
jgi:hypothetical protein